MSDAGRRPSRRATIALALYLVAFTAILWRWIARAGEAYSMGNNALDSRLLTYTLAWIARVLPWNPGRLFDAPMNHPAPAELARTEVYLSGQLLFAPVFWWTGNPVLGINVYALVSYPLAAFAMERLLAAIGVGAAAAWVAGLAFALGPFCVPASVQVLQHSPFYLPLVAFALLRLRERPTAGRATVFAAVFLVAIFAGYYIAFFVCIVASLWTLAEAARPGPGRLRFLAWSLAIGIAGLLLLTWFSLPYLALQKQFAGLAALAGPGPRAIVDPAAGAAVRADLITRIRTALPFLWPADHRWVLGLGLLGCGAGLTRSSAARRAAGMGLLVAATSSALLAAILSFQVAPAQWLPFLAFFRNFLRLQIVTGFGVALLAAAGLEAAIDWIGRRAAAGLAVAAGILLLVTRAPGVITPELDRVSAMTDQRAAYVEIARRVSATGGGPILELPQWWHWPQRDLRPDAMIGAILHGQPIVSGFSTGPPMHAGLVGTPIERLPNPAALDELVDLTGVRWLLLRPEADWDPPAERERFSRALAAATGVAGEEIDGFLLHRIPRDSAHPEWIEAIARGYRPGFSLLGTPTTPIAASETAAASLQADAPPPTPPGTVLSVRLRIHNGGSSAWPGGLTRRGVSPGEVFIEGRWSPGSFDGPPPPPPADQALRRDLPPGEALSQDFFLTTPALPGNHVLELRLRQRENPPFEVPRAEPLGVRIEVLPAAPPAPAG